jgi:HEAT repeat protein
VFGQKRLQTQIAKDRTQNPKREIQTFSPFSAFRVAFAVIILPLCIAGCHLGDFNVFSRRPKISSDPFNVPETRQKTEPFQNPLTEPERNQDAAEGNWLQSPDAPSAADWLSGSHHSAFNSSDASAVKPDASASAIFEQNTPPSDSGERTPNDIRQASYSPSSVSPSSVGSDEPSPSSSQGVVNAALNSPVLKPKPSNSTADAQRQDQESVPHNNLAPLFQDHWVANLELERYRKRETAQIDSFWRWRHRGIEEILMLPPEYQPDYQRLLRHENAIVRANAAIILARSGEEQTGETLANGIHDVSLSLPMRCAAAEALGTLKTTATETLVQLSDVYAEYTDEKGRRKPGVPLLSIELLYAIAAKKPVSQEPCFVRPLESRDPKVRLAAISVWRDHAPNFDATAMRFDATANEQQPQRPATTLPAAALPETTPSPTTLSSATTTLSPAQQTETTLPDCIPKFCGDPNTAIQEAAMLTVAAWRSPEALPCLDLGLRSPMVSVRLAAVRGLGMLRTAEAVALLQPLLQDQSPAIRAETVRAFRQAGLREHALAVQDDAAWEVRKAVAESLAEIENAQTIAVARKYLNDVSPAVQAAMLESLRQWRRETSAPLFLEAMDSNILNTRRLAAELLTEYWRPAAAFAPNDRTQTREAKYQELTRQFQQDVSSGAIRAENLLPKPSAQEDNSWRRANPPQSAATANAVDYSRVRDDYSRVREWLIQIQQPTASQQRQEMIRRLSEIGQPLVPMLEYAVFVEGRELPDELLTEVLPAMEQIFLVAAKLNNPNTSARRSAAAELLAQTRHAEFSPLLYFQLTGNLARENDEIVLLRLWDFADQQAEKLAKADNEWQGTDSVSHQAQTQQSQQTQPLQQSKTFRPFEKALTTDSLAHTSPELHRRACLHMKDYGQADDMAALLNEIHHPATAVSRAALQAAAAIGGEECAAKVKPLLTHQQPLVVMDAAFALDQWNDSAGLDTLERLAVSGDKTTKLAIAQGIRKRRGRKFVPLLIQFLDETGTIRQEALDTLPSIVGSDVVSPQELAYYSIQERAELWKKWNADGSVFANGGL